MWKEVLIFLLLRMDKGKGDMHTQAPSYPYEEKREIDISRQS